MKRIITIINYQELQSEWNMIQTLLLIKHRQLADSDSKDGQNRLEKNTEVTDSPQQLEIEQEM